MDAAGIPVERRLATREDMLFLLELQLCAFWRWLNSPAANAQMNVGKLKKVNSLKTLCGRSRIWDAVSLYLVSAADQENISHRV